MKLKHVVSLLASTAAAVFPPAMHAGGIPDRIVPAGVGVNIHFTRGHEKDLDLIAAAGFKFVREDFFWSSTEKTKGQYDWSEYDELLAQLDQRGIRAYFILDYSNPLYEDSVQATNPVTHVLEKRSTASPQHPESVAAFANWAAAAAKHFHGRSVVWEIWNEPNISFWKPVSNVNQYTALALATCRAVRTAEPDATIVGPATSGFPWEFLESFFKSGALEYLDGVSIHPYRAPKRPPETAAADYRRLRMLMEKYAPEEKKSMPIISGEWGYSSNTRGVSPERQANFIARQQLSNLLCGVPISIWYDWKNDGNDPAENEHNFGTITANLTPKPAYAAIQVLTHELDGYRLNSRFDTGNTNDFVLIFSDNRHQTKLAAWTIAGPRQVSLPLKQARAKEAAFVNGAGQHGNIDIENEHVTVPLDGDPKYIDIRAFSEKL